MRQRERIRQVTDFHHAPFNREHFDNIEADVDLGIAAGSQILQSSSRDAPLFSAVDGGGWAYP